MEVLEKIVAVAALQFVKIIYGLRLLIAGVLGVGVLCMGVLGTGVLYFETFRQQR